MNTATSPNPRPNDRMNILGRSVGRASLERRGAAAKTLVALVALVAFATLVILSTPARAATVSSADLQAGDLFRGETYSAVYYLGEDGLRYVFPNSKVFFTWYDDFEDVKWIADSDLADIQIGGNVTYKPGIKMVKINSSPRVYAVGAGGMLRSIVSEAVARALYGITWNQKVDDLPDGFFGNYAIGRDIDIQSQYDPDVEEADALSINDDKNLRPFSNVSIAQDGYQVPTITISVGSALRWTNTDTEAHSVTEWDRVWGSGTLQPGKTYTRYFEEAGTWHYYSKSHGDDRNIFEGAIIVK